MPLISQVIDGRVITRDVPERQVQIWQRSGWQPVERFAEVADDPVDESIPDEGNPQPSTEEE